MQSQPQPGVIMPKPFTKRMRYSKHTLGVILIVIIALAAILLYLFVFRSNGSKTYSVYHYKSLKTYTIPGTKQDGMSFLLPTELNPVEQVSGLPSNVKVFNHNPFNQGPTTLVVAVASNGQTLTSGDLSSFEALFSHDSQYSARIASYKQIISGWFDSPPKSLTLSKAQTFGSPNIQNDALAFDIKAESKTNVEYQGELLVAASTKGNYYFLIITPANDWTVNQSTWQQSIGSVKIDQ